MTALITILVIAFIAAVSLAFGMRRTYLAAHRTGFTAGRAEGYRAGLSRGHAAGIDQAAELARQLATEGPCTPDYCVRPGLPCLAPACYSD